MSAAAEPMRVLVKEEIAQAGVDMLRSRFEVDVELDMPAEQLNGRIGEYDALIVRSATRVTADLIDRAGRLKVIGRAGAGVDNVDVAAATRRGIVVANAPGSNMVAAAEHAIGLLLAMARNIPQAHAALRDGRWERKRFGGVELCDKTLGVVGFGRIGQLVAARARALEMRVLVHDPFVSAERCAELQVTPVSLERLWAEAEFITLHTPLTDGTRNLVDADAIARMRPGVRLVNAARGGLVDMDALVAGLRSGRIAGAGLDVFPEEPYTRGEILELENVVVTPHLGASTAEAQVRAGLVVAEQVAAALCGDVVSNAVNIPQVGADELGAVRPFLPLGRQLGRMAAGLSDEAAQIEVVYSGGLAERDTRLVTASVVAGALSGRTDDHVNVVNARAVAESRGIQVSERSSAAAGDFTNLVAVACGAAGTVSGTTIGRENRPWLVSVRGQQVEIELAPTMLVMFNDDRPGIIGRVGTLLGEERVNIANMNVSRHQSGDRAAMVLALDAPPPPSALHRLRELEGIQHVRLVDLSD
jgi:D-3-phosphoglycerate dehydrogenase